MGIARNRRLNGLCAARQPSAGGWRWGGGGGGLKTLSRLRGKSCVAKRWPLSDLRVPDSHLFLLLYFESFEFLPFKKRTIANVDCFHQKYAKLHCEGSI